jgi:hypothetical protein
MTGLPMCRALRCAVCDEFGALRPYVPTNRDAANLEVHATGARS